MAKRKRKLPKAEEQAKKERREQFEWVFVRGKQKRIRRSPMIEGWSVEEFILRNADPTWLHSEGLWEHIYRCSEDEESTFDEVASIGTIRGHWVTQGLAT